MQVKLWAALQYASKHECQIELPHWLEAWNTESGIGSIGGIGVSAASDMIFEALVPTVGIGAGDYVQGRTSRTPEVQQRLLELHMAVTPSRSRIAEVSD